MTETNETVDLWGDIVTEPIKTPLSILKEQGALLERKTKGILTVGVKVDSVRENNLSAFPFLFNNNLPKNAILRYAFYIKSPSLNYSYHLFSVFQPVEIFPSIFDVSIFEDEENKLMANDENEFITILGEILQSPKTQRIISSLFSQSTEA